MIAKKYISFRWQKDFNILYLEFVYHNMIIFYYFGYFLYFTVSPF